MKCSLLPQMPGVGRLSFYGVLVSLKAPGPANSGTLPPEGGVCHDHLTHLYKVNANLGAPGITASKTETDSESWVRLLAGQSSKSLHSLFLHRHGATQGGRTPRPRPAEGKDPSVAPTTVWRTFVKNRKTSLPLHFCTFLNHSLLHSNGYSKHETHMCTQFRQRSTRLVTKPGGPTTQEPLLAPRAFSSFFLSNPVSLTTLPCCLRFDVYALEVVR